MKKLNNQIYKVYFVFSEIYKSGTSTLVITIITMIFSGLSPLLTSWGISRIVEYLDSNAASYYHCMFIMVFILGNAILSFCISNVKSTICSVTGLKLTHNIENLAAKKFQKIEQSKIDDPNFLDLYENTLERATYEPLNIFETLFNVFSALFGVAGYLVVLIRFKLWLVLSLLILVIPLFYFKVKLNKAYHKFLTQSTMTNRQIWYYFSLMTEPQNAKEVRIFNLFDYFSSKRKSLFNEFLKGNYRYAKKEIFNLSFSALFAFLAIGTAEFYLLKSVFDGNVSIADFVFYAPSIISFEASLLALISLFASNNRSMLFLDYLFEFLNLPEEKSTVNQKDTQPLASSENTFTIEFKNVSFKYPGSENFALKDVNVKINSGKTFCLVGENGSGKSTFINLLLGLYTPQKGEIFLNGINIEKYDTESYRKLFVDGERVYRVRRRQKY